MSKFNKNYSIIQKFFVQRTSEMLHRKTIDTYSTKVMNPYLIVQEFAEVLEMVKLNTIDYQHNIPAIIEEIEYFFDRNVYLDFNHFTKDYFLTELKKTNKQRYESTLIAAKNLLEYNKNYKESLFGEIESIGSLTFDDDDELLNELKRTNEIISFLVAQLIGEGYSKTYLRQQFEKHFSKKISFTDSLKKFKKSVSTKPSTFEVIFKCLSIKSVQEDIFSKSLKVTNNIKTLHDSLFEKNKQRLTNFVKTQESTRYIAVKVNSKDAYMAFIEAKRKLSIDLDLFHFTHLEDGLYIYPHVLVVQKKGRNYWNYIPLDYVIASKFNAGSHIFEELNDRIKHIMSNDKIEQSTKNKIKSAIRYLRLGHESKEVEHKFLNYWIGLEHMFSNNTIKSSPIQNIKDYFIRLHCNNYLTKILWDAHNLIKRSDLKDDLTDFNDDDYECMTNVNLYNEILKRNKSEDPLLYFRIYRLKRTFFEKETNKEGEITKIHFKDFIEKHQKILDQHLSRMYRIRNQIVHDAAMELNIVLITSNIKYYLLFTLDKVIREFSEENCVFNNLTEFYKFNYFVFENRFCRKGSFEKISEVTDYKITPDQLVN